MPMKERPDNLADAIKQIFFDPSLLAIYALTFVVALACPFLINLAIRKWNQFKMRRHFPAAGMQGETTAVEEDQDVPMELPNGMVGSFNKSILDCFQRASPANSPENKYSAACPFISRENLTLVGNEGEEEDSKNEEKAADDEDMPELVDNNESGNESKPLLDDKTEGKGKKKAPRKKYKDPDPETAAALNKLIERGLHGKLATAQLRAKTNILAEQMSEEERTKEAQIRQEQLAKIFEMMEAQKEKFGINEKDELVEQMKLYSI